MGTDLAELSARVQQVFEGIHREVFAGEPIANPTLAVEVLEPEVVEGVPTLVLLTPWTLNGLAFPPEGDLPVTLRVGGRERPVYVMELAGVGRYLAVNLLGDVSRLQGMDHARTTAGALGRSFRTSIARAFAPPDAEGVENPSRRRLLNPWAE